VANTPGVVYPLFEEGADIMYVPRFVRLKLGSKGKKRELRRKRRFRKRAEQQQRAEHQQQLPMAEEVEQPPPPSAPIGGK
jgi:hypothetical protein